MTTPAGGTLAAPPGRWRLEIGVVVSLGLLVGFAVLVLYPLALMVHGSFVDGMPTDGGAVAGVGAWTSMLSDHRVLSALFNTVALTAVTTAISLPLAIVVAWLLARTDLPGRHWLEFGFWLSFFLPPLGVVQGWILLLDPSFGLVNVGLKALFGRGVPALDIYGWGGIVFGHLVTTAISAKVMLMTPAFRNMDGSLEEAARMAGDRPLGTLRRIVMPVMLPTILVTCVLSVIKSLESFEIELILGAPDRIDVYSTLIYRLVRSDPPDYARACVLGVLIMVVMAGLVWLQTRAVGQRDYATVTGKAQWRSVALRRWRWPVFGIVAAVLMMLTAVPIALLVLGTFMTLYGFFNIDNAWTMDHWTNVLGDSVFVDSVVNTLTLAGGTAAFLVVAGFVVAYVVIRTRIPARRTIDALSWVPFSMPGILFSLAFLWAVLGTPLLTPLYGSTLVLVLAVGLGTLTMGVQIIKGALMQLGPELEEASRLSRASLLQTLRRITVPLVFQSVMVVAVVGFIAAGRNISHLALMVTSDNRPLAIMQLEYMAEGRYEAASIVGLIVVGLTVTAAVVARVGGLRVGPKA